MTECVKIKCDDCKFVEDCVDYGWLGCKKFTPAPSNPMTNEEWFCSLSTEEKARWMSQHFHYCDICNRHVCQGGEECKWYDRNMSESDIFKEWLKAVHK